MIAATAENARVTTSADSSDVNVRAMRRAPRGSPVPGPGA
jgi:hypothetical protein